MSNRPVLWSLFSGAMGIDLGFERQGLGPSLAVELDPICCETIRSNRPAVRVLQADVSQLSGAELRRVTGQREVDVMVGGPPCQSFCPGGTRAALQDPRGNPIFEYLRLVAEARPRRFVLEKVANLVTAAVRHRPIADRPGRSWNLASYSKAAQPRLLSGDGRLPLEPDEQSGSALRMLLETAIAELGYTVVFAGLDAAAFGAPQRRHRFVMLGDRDGAVPALPTPTHGPGGRPECTLRDAIEDLLGDPGPGSQYTNQTRAVFDLVTPGGNWRDLPLEVAIAALGERSYRAGGGKTGFFRRLSWDQPAPTITGRANRKGSAARTPSLEQTWATGSTPREARLGATVPSQEQDRLEQGRRRNASRHTASHARARLSRRHVLRSRRRQHPARTPLQKGAVLRESPNTAVLVGEAALDELTQSSVGGELLLRSYQRAFRQAAHSSGYHFADVVAGMVEVFEREAAQAGDDFLAAWLHHAISGRSADQDSREANAQGRLL